MAVNDSNQGLVAKFHRAFNVPNESNPDNPSGAVADLRARLLKEEADEAFYELRQAAFKVDGKSYRFDRAKLAKELADVLVIAYGTAEILGIDLDWAFRETMASNMTKLDSNGKPVYRADGKVLKGPDYRPPNMELVLNA